MENPATWTKTEKIVQKAYTDWAEARAKGVIGLSLTRTVTDALRKEGLLKEEEDE